MELDTRLRGYDNLFKVSLKILHIVLQTILVVNFLPMNCCH